ncbi:MAG: hypothetical protein PHS97_03890 [Oscillospiraceae bacterium]|nr:hypothetical protein [Oscillospiraceae bacterium]
MNRAGHSFLFCELLIVAVLTALVLALLIPAINHAKSEALRRSCAGNLQGCLRAVQNYAAGNGGWLITSGFARQGWWRASESMHRELGFNMEPRSDFPGAGMYFRDISPALRKITLCPVGMPASAAGGAGNISYGASFFGWEYGELSADFSDGCEVRFDADGFECTAVKLDGLPDGKNYVFLTDSAFTDRGGSDTFPGGTQSVFFERRSAGGFSPLHAAAIRHNGKGNLGFADGHVGGMEDRDSLWKKSYLGYLCDINGLVAGDDFRL